MSEQSVNDQTPNGAPPQGTQFRMDRFTFINSRFPFPDMNHMAPSGFGFPPSINGQQFPTAAPLSNFAYIPPHPVPNFTPTYHSPSMFFPQGVIVNLPNPTPSRVPIPTDNIPKKKKQGWPIRVPKVIPPAKVPSRTKVPSKPSASPIPLHDKNSNNKRQPKDAPQKIKRSKKSNSTDTRGNNSPPVPPRARSLPGRPSSYPTTPAGPSGSNRSRNRSLLIPKFMPKKGPIDNNAQEERGG